jgi:hypothetical protein
MYKSDIATTNFDTLLTTTGVLHIFPLIPTSYLFHPCLASWT